MWELGFRSICLFVELMLDGFDIFNGMFVVFVVFDMCLVVVVMGVVCGDDRGVVCV